MGKMWIGAVLIPIVPMLIAGIRSYVESDIDGDSKGGSKHEMSKETTEGGVLDTWCHSPLGDDCRWYTQCLAKRFPSQQRGEDTYTLGFAVPICAEFTKHRDRFSPRGQKWVNATRACLQIQLVPILSQEPQLTDTVLRQMAFSTHVQCYTAPAPGDPAVFSLPLTDLARIAWITKGAFVKQFSESVALAYHILKGSIS